MESFTLHQLNEHLRRVVALNVSDPIWVKCEIAQMSESRGHFFLNLVEKEETIIAKANAVLWGRTFRRLQREHGRGIIKVIQEGLEVLLQLRVEFNEIYGMQYYVEDVDPDYTLGQLAMQKQITIDKLTQEGLLGKNSQIALPHVLQKIAIISSERAAGYQDYLKQLNENHFNYSFDNHLFPAAMQGENVEEEILHNLKKIRLAKKFDAVVIIRGGGAKLDLLAFDNEKICRAVADFPIPVLTGIGHDIDESILDKVAHTACKTPTAVADFIINHNLFFENQILQLGNEFKSLVQEKIQEQLFEIQTEEQNLKWLSENKIQIEKQKISTLEVDLKNSAQFFLQKEKERIEHLNELYELLHPEQTLKRGYSITSIDGKVIRSIKEVKKESEITTQLSDGIIKSKTKN